MLWNVFDAVGSVNKASLKKVSWYIHGCQKLKNYLHSIEISTFTGTFNK